MQPTSIRIWTIGDVTINALSQNLFISRVSHTHARRSTHNYKHRPNNAFSPVCCRLRLRLCRRIERSSVYLPPAPSHSGSSWSAGYFLYTDEPFHLSAAAWWEKIGASTKLVVSMSRTTSFEKTSLNATTYTYR